MEVTANYHRPGTGTVEMPAADVLQHELQSTHNPEEMRFLCDTKAMY